MAVECAACGGPNPDEARFCSSCGTGLSRRCPSCDTEVTADARFCLSCGTSLAGDGTDQTPTAESATEERKVVSVMFCDLAGFTAHTEQSDPEDVRARLTAFHTAVRHDVERFGGRIEKLMGDGVFCVFGAPTAHEDDPERAVQAALRILDSVEDLNAAHDLDLTVRIAVTTGEAIVQMTDAPDREGIIGDVVNTASRLEGVASLGTVVVDERTFRATRHSIDLAPLDAVTVKGKSEPLPIWQALAAKSRYGVAVDDAPNTPFVGRTEELKLLVDAFERTLARSTPQLVTITGEPGVGKSRLLREFRQTVDDRDDLVYWRQGRCLPYGESVSFWAIGEIVKAHAGILESESPEVATAKLTEAVRALVHDIEDADWITSRLRPLVGAGGTDGGAERAELFTAWTRFFEALSARNPLVMVLEDLHWADDSVVEFLDHLTEWATDSAILVVATARPELFTDRPDWGAGKRDAVTAGLTPLSDADAAALMSALTDRPVMSADLQQTLLEHSGGNPLYVTEYVRLAVEQDWFSRSDRGETLPLPDSIQSIISARIDLLPTEDKTLLQTAAVVGRVFWTAALSFADAGSPDDVRAGLRRLVRREMIRPVRRSSMQGHDEYTFGHVLIRDVAYGRLTRDERARLHAATARWLEAISGEGAGDVAELIAHHLSTSYDLSPDKDPEMRRRIFRFLMLAVERAAAIDAPAAHRLAERALEYTSDDRERGKALLEVGIRAYRADNETISALRGAIEAFQQVGDIEGEIKATSRLGTTYWYMGEGSIVDELDERILELLEGRPPSDVVADATVALASKSQLRGNEDEAMDLVERGLALAQQVGDTKTYARALVIRGSTLSQLGNASGLEDIEAGLAIQLDLNEAPAAISTYNNLATFLNDSGEPVRAEALINQAITLGEQRGLVSHVDFSHMTLIEVLSQLGEWDRVLGLVDERAGLERLRGTQVENGLRMLSCPILHYRGQSQRAWEITTATMPGVRETKDPQGLVPTLLSSVFIAAAVGEEQAARSLALELMEVSADHPIFLGLHLPATAHGYIELGMIDELETLNRRAFRGIDWYATRLRRVDALLAAHAGEHDRALELLDPLIAEADERSQVLLGTIVRIDAADSAIALDDHRRALGLLDVAEPAAKHMKATRLLSAIDTLRAATTSATG